MVSAVFDTERKRLSVRLGAFPWNHLFDLVIHSGREEDGQLLVDGYAVLAKSTQAASAADVAVSHMLRSLNTIDPNTTGSRILDIVYGRASATESSSDRQASDQPYPTTVVYKTQTLSLTADQHAALELGLKGAPIAAIKAAFGTDETVIGAFVAGLLVSRDKGPVIVTASSNHAVAHFANTLLALNDFAKFNLMRFVSESAFLDDAPATSVDINEILKNLGLSFSDTLFREERDVCERYRRGRLLYEAHIQDFDRSMSMTDKERDEFLMADKDVSKTVKKVVRAMWRVRPPHVLLITTASLTNTTTSSGIFKNKLKDRKVIIIDEASQVPEPILAALSSLIPQCTSNASTCEVSPGGQPRSLWGAKHDERPLSIIRQPRLLHLFELIQH